MAHATTELRTSPAKAPNIAVVGSSVMDLIFIGGKTPGPGETVFADASQVGYGGKGANQAIAAARCGAKVQMVSCVGDDLFGAGTLKNFEENHIGTEHVHTVAGKTTGMAYIAVGADGQNRIQIAKGANESITPDIVDKAKPMLAEASGIIMQHEMPLETVYHTIAFAREKGIPTFLNPSPAPEAKDNFDISRLDGLDYLVVNEHEAQILSGMKVETAADAEKSAQHLLGTTGIKKIIVTLGEKGAVLAGRDGMKQIPAFKVNAINTAGAGDAFLGSFASFIGQGIGEEEALSRASLYAALSTTEHGTQVSYPKRDQFELQWNARHREGAQLE